MKTLLSTFIACLLVTFVWGTHNRAGEITYRHLGNLTYEITVTTFTDPAASSADRCTLDVDFGDGSVEEIRRINGVLNNKCSQITNTGDGELIKNQSIRKNIYRTTHTYAGPGTYVISMVDPNRVDNIQNIPNSVSVPFFIRSTLVISSTVGHNTSPQLDYLPIDNGCVEKPYFHNPGAIDPDGDSLHFKFTVCYGDNGDPIPGYVTPDQIGSSTNNVLSIDPLNGTLSWLTPQLQGEYNVCILIEEYRRDTLSGKVLKVGDIMRDMQISIGLCDNEPPLYDPMDDVCVLAGDMVDQKITFYDEGDLLTLSGVGLPLTLVNNPATFNQPISAFDSVSSQFQWQTDCDHIRKQPYQMVFRASDNRGYSELVNFSTLDIHVIGPPSNSLDANPKGNSIELKWSANPCSNALGYKIYRKIDSLGYVADKCTPGVPTYTGYKLIAKVQGINNLGYIDDDGGNGLIHGHKYCLLITAYFVVGVESLPTLEFCSQLNKDVPVITRVTVSKTELENGIDTIMWSRPTEIDDTVQYLGPYKYEVYRKTDQTAEELVWESNQFAQLVDADTFLVDSGLNTQDVQYSYRIKLVSGTDVVGFTQRAKSVFLNPKGLDRSMYLTWNVDVPWGNQLYEVYRYHNDSARFILIDSVESNEYLDSGLTNEVSYCYLVKSIGRYSSEGFIDPIINWSQLACAVPTDTVPPCPPLNSFITGECDLDKTTIVWENPRDVCQDDIWKYKVYYATQLGGDYEEIYETKDADELMFEKFSDYSIAGCYAVTAIDSSGNESELGEKLCIDNCPQYTLPNVFTPGGDGHNDFFVPFPYKYVESIDLEIFDRWGGLVFKTKEPNISWDGTHYLTKRNLPSGVYFYVCTVNEIRLTGIEPRMLKGTVTLFNQSERTPNLD